MYTQHFKSQTGPLHTLISTAHNTVAMVHNTCTHTHSLTTWRCCVCTAYTWLRSSGWFKNWLWDSRFFSVAIVYSNKAGSLKNISAWRIQLNAYIYGCLFSKTLVRKTYINNTESDPWWVNSLLYEVTISWDCILHDAN